MEIELDINELIRITKALKNFVSKSEKSPALKYIHVVASSDGLKFEATDSMKAIEYVLPTDVIFEMGECLLLPDQLLKILSLNGIYKRPIDVVIKTSDTNINIIYSLYNLAIPNNIVYKYPNLKSAMAVKEENLSPDELNVESSLLADTIKAFKQLKPIGMNIIQIKAGKSNIRPCLITAGSEDIRLGKVKAIIVPARVNAIRK